MKNIAIIFLLSAIFLLIGLKTNGEEIKYAVKQGDTILLNAEQIANEINYDIKDLKFIIFNKKYNPIDYGDKKYLIVGIHFEQKPATYHLSVIKNSETVKKIPIIVNKTTYHTIEINEPRTTFSGAKSEQRKKENESIIKMLCPDNQSYNYTIEKNLPPVEKPEQTSKARGAFGTIRKWGNNIITRHRGVDLKAPFVPVYAINDGKIAMARTYLLEGKFIIIDHGSNIFSLYAHMSKLYVKEREEIKKGQKIGISGNTGNAIGPHLHFAIKVNCATIDPMKFIKTINAKVNNENEE